MKIKRVVKWSFLVILLVLVTWLFVTYWTSTDDCNRNSATPSNPMKAIVNCEYGVDNLKLQEIGKPTPKDNEILVRVRAASINPVDGHLLRGALLMRPITGLRKPKNTRFGGDFAGVVEAVGKNVTNFKPGDEVFGAKRGAVADYVCVPADRAAVLKPANVTFEQAGSVAIAALTALQGLRDKGHIQAGQKVLINGASGGVGTFAVQIAKAFGAEVTAVCSTSNVDAARSMGADHVIDYTKEDFTQNGQHYDLIVAANGNRSISEYKRALRPNGTYVVTGGSKKQTYQAMLLGPWISMTGTKKMGNLMAKPNTKDLGFVKELLEAGKVIPVIDRRYPLSETAEALRYLEAGRARGKVVITVDQNTHT